MDGKTDGIIVVNKPSGCTSFDVVDEIRKIFHQRKVGHTGTLDPMATGVLPILLGRATKIQRFMREYPKEYVATLRFGISTDTQDITGKILRTSDKKIILDDVKNILPKFIGKISQLPPMYSAIKKDGKKLCDLARKGIEVEREKRIIDIYAVEILDYNSEKMDMRIRVECSPGTYIRTLIQDIGDSLNVGATMTGLIRKKSNGFDLEHSYTLEQLKEYCRSNLDINVISIFDVLNNYNVVNITESQKSRFKNGIGLSIDSITEQNFNIDNDEIFRVVSGREFIGLGKINEKKRELSVLKNFGST